MQAKSPRGVQQAEVAAAADALVAEGQKPTVERVRLKLGRGSPNSLGPMLDTWFEGLAARLGLAGAESGAGLPPAARVAFDGAWLAAVELARTSLAVEFDEERAKLVEERQALLHLRAELETDKSAVLAKEQASDALVALAKGQLEDRNAEITRIRGELDHARHEVASGRAVIAKQVLDHEAERGRLAGMVEAQMRALKSAQEQAAADNRRLLEEVDRARQTSKQAQQALASAERAHATQCQAQIEEVRAQGQQIRELELQLLTCQERLAAAERRLTEYRQLEAKLPQSSRRKVRPKQS